MEIKKESPFLSWLFRFKKLLTYVARANTTNMMSQERIKGTEKASPIHPLFHR